MSVDISKYKSSPNKWNKEELRKLSRSINNEIGDRSLVLAIEEMSELTKSITKHMRFSNSGDTTRYNRNRLGIIEEMADVIISVDLIKENLHISDFELSKMISYKINKKSKSLKNGNIIK